MAFSNFNPYGIEDEIEDNDEMQIEDNQDSTELISALITGIRNDLDEDKINRDIKEFSSFADVSDWTGIPRYFDSLASLTSLVSKYNDWPSRFRVVDYLVSCFGPLKEAVADYAVEFITARSNNQAVSKNVELINGVSMFVILVQRICAQLQAYVIKLQKDVAASITGRKGKRNNLNDLDEDASGWINVQRVRMINCICELLTCDVEVNGKTYRNCVEYIWKPDTIDPDLLRVCADIALGMLDDPDCLRYTSQGWLQKVFKILKILTVDYHKADEMAKRILEKTLALDYLKESSTTTYPFIEPLVAIGYSEIGNRMNRELRPLLEKLTILVCAITKQIAASKALSLLIQSLGEHIPDVLLINLTHVFHLLNHDSPMIRSAAITALYDVYKSNYLADEICKKFENRKRQRSLIFKRLLSHFRDSNAQTRSKTVHLLTKLMEGGNHIPVEFQCNGLISLVGRRLNDKSVMVRKNAVQFLTTFLTYNGFGHDFDRNIIIDRLRQKIRDKKLLRNPANTVVDEVEARFTEKNAALKVIVRQETEKYVEGHQFGDIGVEGFESKYEECVDKLLDNTSVSVTILMHIYAKKNLLPLLDETMSEADQKRAMYSWLYDKLFDDYVNNEMRKHHLNDEQLVLESQRVEDYQNRLQHLKFTIELLKNKLVVEEELRTCVSLALRSVLMGELSEMKESIKFLAKCKQFNIRDAENAIRSMCSLVWRNSPEVRKELLDAASDMFISQYTNSNEKETIREDSTVANLMNAMRNISESDRTSVEEVIYLLAQKDLFSKGVISKLWAIASAINRDLTFRIDALRILYAITRSEFGVSESRNRLRTLQRMLNLGTSIAYEALRVVSVMNTPTKNIIQDVNAPVFRIPNEDSFFTSLEQLFFNEMLNDSNNENWFGILQISIDIILNISKNVNILLPQFAAGFLFRARRAAEFYMFYKKEAEKSSGSRKMCAKQRRDYWAKAWVRINERLVTFIGEVAVRIHAFIQTTMPKIHARYEAQMRYANTNEEEIREEPPRFLNDLENSILKRRAIFDYTLEASQGESDNFMNSLTQTFSERRVLKPQRLLGRLVPIVVYALRAKNMPERVRQAASLAFGKFMTLSTEHSEFAAPTFFTIMSRSPVALVRCNLLATCSDFAFSQPNLFELYAPSLYKMSRDADAATRESAILVLSHLMSNDMIQIRGTLSEPARCLCDDVTAVQSIAASFFSDLNRRGDALVNLLPEFIYRLACTGERLPFAQYQQIFEFLIVLIREKARTYVDSMIERVCSKFAALDSSLDSHRDSPKYLAFALSKFTLSDTGFYKLKDCIRHWSRFLNHRYVAQNIKEMLTVLEKNTKNPEVQKDVTELFYRIEKIQKEGLTADVLTVPIQTPKRANQQRKGQRSATRQTKTTAKKRGRLPTIESDESDD